MQCDEFKYVDDEISAVLVNLYPGQEVPGREG